MVELTTLVEDRTGTRDTLRREHGISVFVKTDRASVLFDTGQSDAFLHNAHLLRVDLHAVEKVVISHGHYDHTNGLEHLVHSGHSRFDLYVGSGFFDPKHKRIGPTWAYLGPSFDRAWLKQHGVSVFLIDATPMEIAPGMWLVRGFNRTDPHETDRPDFVVERSDETAIDDFRDELALVVRDAGKLVVVVGCSHPGIMNMLTGIRESFSEPITALVGGFHLLHADVEHVKRVADFLNHLEIDLVGACHCTGSAAMDLMKERIPGYFDNVPGTQLRI